MNILTQSAFHSLKTSLTTRSVLLQGGEKISLVKREFISRGSKRSVFPSLKMLSANERTTRLRQRKATGKTSSWTILCSVQGAQGKTCAQGMAEDLLSALTLEKLGGMCRLGSSMLELVATQSRSQQFIQMYPTWSVGSTGR